MCRWMVLPAASLFALLCGVIILAADLSRLDMVIGWQICRRFDVGFTLGNAVVFLVCSSLAASGEFSQPLTIAANLLCRLLMLVSAIFIDAVSTRHRLLRVACACVMWLRLLVVQLVAPQLGDSVEVCLLLCAKMDSMAHGECLAALWRRVDCSQARCSTC